MIDDIANLYKQILEQEGQKNRESVDSEIEQTQLIESSEEPFASFLSKLEEKISEELIENIPQNQIVENIEETNPLENQIQKNGYLEELQKIGKPQTNKVLTEDERISAIVSEQVQEEIGKVKTQISRMAFEGGGGSVAVQYANGGVMNGDLNVNGKYLSGGIDLSTLIGAGGGGGGLSGTTDRLVSGSQVFKLNTDGTFNFPNNIITPQDEVILTLESTKVLDNYYNRLALSPYGFFASDHNGNSITIDSVDSEILIDSQNTYFWKFNNQGALEGPFGTLSVSGDLSASGRIYQNGNDLQSEIESISAISVSTKTTVQSNSGSWNYQGSDIKALTGGWVGGNSAYTTVLANSASWAIDSTTDTGVRALTSNWENTFTTVQSNSSTWDYQGSDIKALTGGWVGGNSAYTTVQSYSATWGVGGTGSDVSGLSGNWENTYSTVSSNSALWESTYTTVLNNSASWGVSSITTTTSATQFLARVANADSVDLNRGDVVYTFGAIGDVMSVKKASNTSDLTSARTLGIINETIIPNGIGYVTLGGSMDKLHLGSYNEGDVLWLGTAAGTFTNVRPTQPLHGVYLGVVERANNGNGIAYIKVQNGQELDEIHDVLITSVSAGQILRRNNTNDLWVNTNDGDNWDSSYSTVQSNSATTWNYQGTDIKDLSANWQNTYLNQTNYLPLTGGTLTGSLSVLGTSKLNGITELGNVENTTATIYVDTSKVGINTETPNEELTIVGDVSATGKYYGDGSSLTGIILTGSYLPLSGGDLTGELTTTSTISSTNNIYSNSERVVTGESADTTPVYKIRALTQTEYNAIAIKDDNTIYFIKE